MTERRRPEPRTRTTRWVDERGDAQRLGDFLFAHPDDFPQRQDIPSEIPLDPIEQPQEPETPTEE